MNNYNTLHLYSGDIVKAWFCTQSDCYIDINGDFIDFNEIDYIE